MEMDLVVAVWLFLLSISDSRGRTVPLSGLICGVILSVAVYIVRCAGGNVQWMYLVTGLLPGSGILLLAWMTQKVGYADGIVLLCLGMLYGLRTSFILLCVSLLLLSLCSIVLLVLRRAERGTRMPYLPFLELAFVIRMVMR